jgi:carboxyl-terminal processing protease
MTDGWVVTFSRLPDLNPGDIVFSVGGKPIEQFYAEYDGMIEGSSESTRRRRFLWQTYLWPAKFELGLAGGKQVAIDRLQQTLQRTRGFQTPQGEPKLPAGIAYLRLSSFEDPKIELSAVKRVKELQSAHAIIFDVRGNGGGSTPSQLIAALLNRPWRDFRFTTPFSIAHAGAQNQVRLMVPTLEQNEYDKGYLDADEEFKNTQILTPGPLHPPAKDAYNGKVFLRIDGACNSACEDFVEPFHASHRGVLVGETTNGSSGQPYMFDFGNGMSFRVSTKRYYLPDGAPFEGVGIKPDVEVKPSLADWKTGRDPVLARALELAGQ